MSMLLSEATAAFTANGVPTVHVRFHETPSPPYAKLYLNDSSYNYSDNRTHKTLCEYEAVLHAEERDMTLEGKIEDALDAAKITYRKSGGYLASEDLITTTYRFEVYER